ncbi:MAG: hypothetical protein IJH40_00595 [Ruminococcus sp.]|uniref:hypothetical protein n=1 Tax=Ruminococcus sp. TaxID=41978 RepID=UPI002872BE7A|nr:hypothetical protein [Ruminococcus sp.]MBQ3284114.1 hypothetical protein [Ruminococcus sp.]
MKKSFRTIALLLAVILISVSLCSCEWLEEKKANRAVYSDDKSEITYQDNVYKLILANKIDFVSDYSNGWTNPYVTTKDVPLLLTDEYGDPISVLRDGTVIRAFADIDGFSDDFWITDKGGEYYATTTHLYYVRSDKYDEIKETVEKAELDHYYFEYWSYGDYDYDDAEYSTNMLNDYRTPSRDYQYVLLDDSLTDIVNKALKASTEDKVSYRELSTGDYDLKVIDFYPCDKNMIITQSGIEYYFIQDGDKYYFWDGNYFNDIAFYPLNEDDAAHVKELYEKYPDAVSYEDVLYQFDNTYANETELPRPIDDLMY